MDAVCCAGSASCAVKLPGTCTSSKKCGECEGDCDRDSDCNTGLTCFQRNGKTKVPGCGGTTTAGQYAQNYDFCVSPLNLPASAGR